ncbi:hypothetical protein MKX03_002465, partial [Papaver bracteatum]
MEKQLPPDEERCTKSSGYGIKRSYRCKNFRMGYGAAADDDTVPKTKRCEKHYNYYVNYQKYLKKKKKKKSGDGEENWGSKRRMKKKVMEEEDDLSLDDDTCD